MPEFVEIREALAEIEIPGIVDRGFGAQSFPFLVILLDARPLVIHMKRRDRAVGDHSRSEYAARATCHPALEDELHLLAPISRFSRITCSKKIRPLTRRS